MTPIIRVDRLSKRYRINEGGSRRNFREVLTAAVTRPSEHWRKLSRRSSEDKTFWALKDISFDVEQGEALGIIGRNGAGKSTLLRVLSRITEPTLGRIELGGRVGSLLEVGTGFHPELTGRENIYLNGAILGMRRSEIRRKFDEIVAFAEVERFLDTQVKHYSSGMYMRLAFAVAAHLEPEILVVDEVLAVGDIQFQQKCLGKMEQLSGGEGRTVLFVSHNMLVVQKLCKRTMLLEHGAIAAMGLSAEIVAKHIATQTEDEFVNAAFESASGPTIVAARVLTPAPRTDCPLDIELSWYLPESVRGIKIGIGFNTPDGTRIFDSAPEDLGLQSPETAGRHKAIFHIPGDTLMARRYHISIGLWKGSHVYEHRNPAFAISVTPGPSGPYAHEVSRDGLVHVNVRWNFKLDVQ
jgi:lipopolysaccharide transport system ATP-binding protein